ncbi:MAG: hypothetical protein EHM47_04310 [Ignavibacteriales bacterium]|nr:MAG: hypothetical protein EHM47_04310 [Ignavibacteriales bacterium]
MPLANKELIKKITQAYINGDKNFVLNHLSNEIKWKIVGMPEITGKNNFIKTMEVLDCWLSVPEENKVNIIIKNIIAEGAYVVVEGTCKGNFSVSNSNPSYCDVYRIKDGLIEEITTYIVDVSSNEEKKL